MATQPYREENMSREAARRAFVRLAVLMAVTTTALHAADTKSAGEWRTLFDGKSTAGWRGYKSPDVPAGWAAKDGVLIKDGKTRSADLVTKDQYGDFELEFDWKLAPGGNAGVLYRGTEEYDHIYWSAPEYQLLDDIKGADNKSRLTSAGAAYAILPSPAGHVKPVGEWNRARIVVKGNHVEHWLNGVKLLEYEFGSADWTAKVQASKFKDWPNYGKSKRGYIALQGDHEGSLAFRNIRIRELK